MINVQAVVGCNISAAVADTAVVVEEASCAKVVPLGHGLGSAYLEGCLQAQPLGRGTQKESSQPSGDLASTRVGLALGWSYIRAGEAGRYEVGSLGGDRGQDADAAGTDNLNAVVAVAVAEGSHRRAFAVVELEC